MVITIIKSKVESLGSTSMPIKKTKFRNLNKIRIKTCRFSKTLNLKRKSTTEAIDIRNSDQGHQLHHEGEGAVKVS